MVTVFVIDKGNGRYVSKDGRSCMYVERAKRFSTQQAAQQFLSKDVDDLMAFLYLSPLDIENQIWLDWRVRKVTTTTIIEMD